MVAQHEVAVGRHYHLGIRPLVGVGGGNVVFFERLPEADPFDFGHHGGPLEIYGYAACYSPDPGRPGKALLPFDPASGRFRNFRSVDGSWIGGPGSDDHDTAVALSTAHDTLLKSSKSVD